MRKKSGTGGGLVVIGVLVVLLAMTLKEAWFGLGALAVAWFAYKKFAAGNKQSVDENWQAEGASQQPTELTIAPVATPAWRPIIAEPSAPTLVGQAPLQPTSSTTRFLPDVDEPVRVTAPPSSAQSEFKVPEGPKHFGPAKWIPRGVTVEIAGILIPGGMLYVGTILKTPSGANDPCLIDPSKPVASHGEYTERQMGYWPSYSEISNSARRAYLNWLAGGRSDPDADVGYVFIFFYGLERRAIIDAKTDAAAVEDWPIIATELRRLLGIYGEKSGSFRSYASELLNWVSLSNSRKLYERPIPELIKSFELPMYIKLALGQAALDGAPVPTPLALAWVKLDPNYYPRTAATRCGEQLNAMFEARYLELYGSGLVIPKNRTKLKFVYRPASAGFRGYNEIKLTFGETPDVSVLTKPIQSIRAIVDAATDELDAYSRFVGRNTEARDSLEGVLLLPQYLWPLSTRQAFDRLKDCVAKGPATMAFQELQTLLGARAGLNKDRTQALARTLFAMNIGFEPDILGGARQPKPEELVVLFALPVSGEPPRTAPAYQAALLTLQLASSVAAADGSFGELEMHHLSNQIQAWVHLAPSHQNRLSAHLQLLLAAPATLASLKKRMEMLDASARGTIAFFMAILAQADGTVSPQEVKMLEKIYKILGLDVKRVFSDLHAASSSDGSASVGVQPETPTAEFKLDTARIAALQQDTAKVSALLASIFTEDAVEQPSVSVLAQAAETEPEVESNQVEAPGLLGLDEAHAALTRLLLTRPQWTREEAQDAAADLELMLDGALERINEAFFDAHDVPFTEGDDPIEVNSEVREKIEA
ncbi:MAG: TerB N-terminal domain-containing protein [Leptothrix sp. (in: b-proteobacteria)]